MKYIFNIKRIFTLFAFLFSLTAFAQKKIHVYKIADLQKRIENNNDTLYIVNFWATWCKPCVAELPDFEKINNEYKTKKVKVLLVSMDFREDMKKRVIPFLKKNKYTTETVLLDETDGSFIDKISKDWSGAIPGTLFIKNQTKEFVNKKIGYEFLNERINFYSK
ncbi:MAG: TlpA disulfide reductase family protein [Bacteroidota bacterium]|nr:TlpA disulfide reductase family protein [Bacteroidota bacterium]